jgi:phospholipase/carboxylesterase
MLHYAHHVPRDARDGAPLLVLLHGRGSDERDLMGLVPHLPAGLVVVSPRAPFSGIPWGYGPGWAWYRFLGRNRPEPASFEESQRSLGDFLRELPEHLPVKPGPLVLGGFSQGGTMSLAHALRNPGTVPAVLNFSGFLADHPTVSATPETVKGTRVFWGHGTEDPQIPIGLAVEGRAALRAAGADLEAHDYPMGHSIEAEELADAVRWAGWESADATK